MATAQFIHDGKSIDYTPGADVAAGDVVVQNDLLGVAKLDIRISDASKLYVKVTSSNNGVVYRIFA